MVGYQLQQKYTDMIKLWERRIYLVNLMIGYTEPKIKKQTIYNYRNLYKLMSVAPKLLNCCVNMTILLKTIKFFLITLKKMKNRYLEKTSFILHAKTVFLTFIENNT